jgi:hypothetical protein
MSKALEASCDAHRDDGKRFVARADEKLTAFLELRATVHTCRELSRQSNETFAKLGLVKRI